MRTGPVASTIRIASDAGVNLRQGERVTVEVIKVLAEGKWAVGVRGRVFPAVSSIPLSSGDRLSAVVERSGRQVLLRLAGRAAESPPAAGVAAAALERVVAQALAMESVPADEAVLAKVRARVRSFGGPARKTARTLAVAAAKGIDPDSPGLEDLLAVLHFEDSGRRGGHRGPRLPRRRRAAAAAVRDGLARERGDSPLALFNALSSAVGTWVAIPFVFRCGSRDLVGTARFLYAGSTPVRLALEVSAAAGGPGWGFALSERGGGRRLQIYCASEEGRRRALSLVPTLRAKLQNHGVNIDDSINETRLFDGYSGEGSAVDLLG